ncbi:MAG: outer membrane beta-barrel protein [Chitinophagaceae bacterium]
MKRISILITFLLFSLVGFLQNPGIITGNVMDEKNKALEGATVELISLKDSLLKQTSQTNKTGDFLFSNISLGFYKLIFAYVGMQFLKIDSIHFRVERFDFNLTDIILKTKSSENLDEVIIYAEKPLVQSKEGNITFNAGESALSAGSNVSDLLTNVPLVSKDPNGKITVRGKEPKILIDDKPVELNQQQLQDLLESMQGSSIEKIEVLTNPPPQYANEQGGVINIVTKKGKVGKGGRLHISTGTRGEVAISGSYSYRKKGFSLAINSGVGYGRQVGEGYSIRNNFYTDSSNFFNTKNNSLSKFLRPNFRVNMDYDISKTQSFNFVLQFNQNNYHNETSTEYTNINRVGEIYRLSERTIGSEGDSYSPNTSLSYLKKGKIPGETFRIITSANLSVSSSNRDFFQQFFTPAHLPNGIDSTQKQINKNRNNGYTVRVDYNRPLKNKTTFLSVGTIVNRTNSHINTNTIYLKKPEGLFFKSDLLSNEFRFHQTVLNFRGSVKQMLKKNLSITAGATAENTMIWFELYKENRDAKNDYWTWLPLANFNYTWKEAYNLTFSYRRSIRRPGINELNPTIDFGDPYNVRFGNEKLEASTAHNFDLIFGKTKPIYFANIGMGYNIVENIFSQVRTLLPDGKTQVTWENISGRKEYEISTWGGVTISKKLRSNLSASYTYNEYSEFDKTIRRYRNGGSFTSNINNTWTPKDIMSFTGSFTFNRFANPQGFARWNWSMNLGIQRRFFDKRFTITLNVIDPFLQKTRNFTYGPNFFLQSYNTTQTRNFRVSLGYNFTKPANKPVIKTATAK